MRMKKLEKYVGHIVRLNKKVFQEIARRAARHGEALENRFLVATVSREMHKLICYGANMRVAVSAADVILI